MRDLVLTWVDDYSMTAECIWVSAHTSIREKYAKCKQTLVMLSRHDAKNIVKSARRLKAPEDTWAKMGTDRVVPSLIFVQV
jgi:hypothetical protein